MTRRDPTRRPKEPPGVRVYVLVVALVAVFGVAASWVLVGPPKDIVALATLLALGFISVWVQEKDVGSKVPMSFLSIVVIAGVALIGPFGCAVVGAVPVMFERGDRRPLARVFNASMLAIQGVIGGLVYFRLGGAQDIALVEGPAALLLQVGVPLMAADIAQMLVNAVLLSGVMRLSTGVPPRRFFIQIVTGSGPAYIGYGVIGFLLVILWVPADIGPFSAVLILAPLFVARWAFVQYGEEQRAHERTLSALVTAVETKDPSAAGHSERIARLAEWMAEPLSVGTQEVQALRYAAMLHDVGKIGVPTRILRRPRTLSFVDLEALTRHSALGVKVVRDIEFLSGSLDGIRHHHERWDGLGYPDSLAGDEIPLISRVIAVADAFDALTTDRDERPALTPAQALKQIEQRRGRQFDPHVVAALATVVERHEWPVTTATEEQLEQMRGYLDHDDPIAWEQVWTAAPRSRPAGPQAEPATRRAGRHGGDDMADETGRIPDESGVAEQVRAP
jgi:HD domain